MHYHTVKASLRSPNRDVCSGEKMPRKKTAEHCGNMLGHLNLGEGNMFDRNDTKVSLKDLPKDNHGRPLQVASSTSQFNFQLESRGLTDATSPFTLYAVGWRIKRQGWIYCRGGAEYTAQSSEGASKSCCSSWICIHHLVKRITSLP